MQMFLRTWDVVVPIGITLAAIIVLTVWLSYSLAHVPQPVFLHYSTELGVDALGSPRLALLLPGALLVFLIVNTAFAVKLIHSHKTMAHIILWISPALAALAFWFGMLILRVNGA